MSWVKLHKKFKEWEWYDDINTKVIFLHLLLSANYKDKKWHGIMIKRGQILVGTTSLADESGLTRQNVRTCLERLKSTNEITTKSTNRYTIITIVKYEEYQSKDEEPTNEITSQLTNNQPTTNQQLTTTKERKNIRKKERKNIYIGDFQNNFENLWELFEKVGSKKKAKDALGKIKGVDYETIIAGIERYNAYARASSWYSKQHFSTWLNQCGWDSEWPIILPAATTPKERAPTKSKWELEAERLAAKYAAEDQQSRIDADIEPNLCIAETIREDRSGA